MSQDDLRKLQDQVWQIDDEIISLLGNRGEEDYLDYLKKIIGICRERVVELISKDGRLKDDVLGKIDEYSKKIFKVVEEYLMGDIAGSINKLKKSLIVETQIDGPTATYYADAHIPNNILYRCRKNEEERFETMDLFHVPFDKRGIVSTMRFSVPGFPCLYMGSSPYCCWKELNTPREFTIAELKYKGTVSALDLRFKINYKEEYEVYNYLKLYPFRIACSIPVSKKRQNDKFKPEYIIPQLLLHMSIIHNALNARFQGVVATSTKYFKKPNIFNDIREADNFIFPARKKELKMMKEGYSKWLEKNFVVDSLFDSRDGAHGIKKSTQKDYWRNVVNELKKNKLR